MNVVAEWIWRLLPGNPMVVRIVEGGSRRVRHLWVRMGYLGALIALVLIGLLSFSSSSLGGEVSLTELAKSGTWVFAIVAYGQVILVCLLAPLFMAGAIGSERAGETFDILLTTPLSNLQIVLGSLAGRLFFVLALLFSGLPLFAVLLIFGGVPIGSVFVAFAVAALTTLLVGSVAIFLSTLRAGGRKAVFAFVISIAAYLVAAWVLDVGLLRRLSPGNYTTWLTPLHPLLVLETSLAGANYGPPPPELLLDRGALARFYLSRPLAAFTILTLLLSFALTAASALFLRAFGQGEATWLYALKRKLRVGLPGPGGGTAERTRPAREVWHNPVAWREASTRGRFAGGILARWAFVVVGLFLALLLLALYHTGALPTIVDDRGTPLPDVYVFRTALLALLMLEVAVVTLVAIYMSAGSVSREREDGTLDLVLTTPITPRFYIWGKLQGLVRFLSMLLAVPVLTVALVSVYAVVGHALGWETATYKWNGISAAGAAALVAQPYIMLPEAAVLVAIMLVPFVALCVAAGMSWSLKAKGVLGAVVPTIAIIGAASLVLALCGWQAADNIPYLGAVVNAFSPATNIAMILDPWERIEDFGAAPEANRIWLFIAAACAAGGYSLIVWSMITGMVKGFDQTVRRLSGAA